jgi:acetylornithine deacetylase
MAEARLEKPIHLAFSFDEEVGCVGVRSLLDRLAGAEVKPEACFVGEPTGMEVVIGHKGKRSVRATVVGQTCHSSLAPQGVNAVEFGAMLAAEISRIGERLMRDGARDALYDVPHSTGHVGVLRGGTALNIVPDLCEIMFEFRVIGGEDPDRLVDEVVAFARERLEPRMRAVNPACGIEFDVFAGFPGLDTPPDDAVVTLATSLTGGNRHGKVAFGTEAGLFQQVAGIPTAIVGPGSIEQAHKADEWIGIEQLERCAAFVDRLTDHASK